MSAEADQNVKRILTDLRGGDPAAGERLLPVVYDELRAMAGHFFASQPPNHTLQPTMLANDVFMKLSRKTGMEWKDRAHFLAVAAKAMRDLLVDHARRKRAEKRGGGWNRITLTGLGRMPDERPLDVLDLEGALHKLGEIDQRQERIVELRFFGGLTFEEVARVLGVSERTVMHDWRMARAWLRSRLQDE